MHTIPVVGVSGSILSDESKQTILREYCTSVLQARAIPMLLSLDMDEAQTAACLDVLDGLLLAGGSDLGAALYGEPPAYETKQEEPLRDRFELMLIRQAYRRSMPILAICRGVQTLNVALGGTLYQDLPTQFAGPDGTHALLHKQSAPPREPSHLVVFSQGSPLRELYGSETLKVNSMHHQAVKRLADPLSVCATARDGVVEGLWDTHQPFVLGVQWHPERLENGAPLFSAFQRACADYDTGKER